MNCSVISRLVLTVVIALAGNAYAQDAETKEASGRVLISNLDDDDGGEPDSPFQGNGKAIGFTVKGTDVFRLESVTLRLRTGEKSRPVVRVLVDRPRSEVNPPAAGLGGASSGRARLGTLSSVGMKSGTYNDVFKPQTEILLAGGQTYWIAVDSAIGKDPELFWLKGNVPERADGDAATLAGQVYGSGDPSTWDQTSSVVNCFHVEAIKVAGGKASSIRRDPSSGPGSTIEPDRNWSGIYPHLAMFNTPARGECGVGAVAPWADRLWVVTFSPGASYGSEDKLFEIDKELNIRARPESVGGTPAGRLIHRESNQLFIGPYAIDSSRTVRAIPPRVMPGRLTAIARHLSDPAGKIYYASMEEGLYEVDVKTLAVRTLYRDVNRRGKVSTVGPASQLPGNHGKGLYSGQGRLVYSNNGENGRANDRRYDQTSGCLAEWDGKKWTVIRRNQFLDVTGPGSIYGNLNPEKDPLWAIGWDHRSLLLTLLDQGKWSTYRLPKASHTYDGTHGYNTEWPRIGDIGDKAERLLFTHGMFYRLPSAFSRNKAAGVRPRSSYLKVLTDSCRWQDKIVFGCNDLSNEPQAVRLNPRKALGKLVPGVSHSNLWFVNPNQIDQLGPPLGRGAVWIGDPVKADQPSDPFLFAGFDKRGVHLAHTNDTEVIFSFEVDVEGNGRWSPLRKVTVPARGNSWVAFNGSDRGEWVRVRTDKDVAAATAFFHFADNDERTTEADERFNGIATATDRSLSGGLVRIKAGLAGVLGFAASVSESGKTKVLGYYEMGTDVRLRRVDDAEAKATLEDIAAVPTGIITVDEASALYVDEEGRNRYRLPKGNPAFDQPGALGPERIARELVRERNLFNCHGTLYELPYRNAGGFAKIRPITTHNRRIKDFASWRGLLVITGIAASGSEDNRHIIQSEDGRCALWVGAIDDLWAFGKPRGRGGPWKDSPAKAGIPSDPYLMTGYDRKHLTLSHQSNHAVSMRVEVDIDGMGRWQPYQTFEVAAGESVKHGFPDEFQAYWVRIVADKDTIATAQLVYE